MFLIDILANLLFARLARKFGLKMNVFNKNLPSEFTRLVHMVEDCSDLTVFSEKTFPAVIWSRQLSPKTQSWIDKIDPNLLPNARKVLHKSAIKETLEHIFNNARITKSDQLDWLLKDITKLGEVFSNLMQVDFLRLRLDVVSTNSCRKFHVDTVTGRLICTYRGEGTQCGISRGENEPVDIFSVPTGSPVLLSGLLSSKENGLELLHRSPPIEGTGVKRFVLVFDPIIDPENEG